MRVALISAGKTTDCGELRASLMLGGRSVLEWQAQTAINLGCERIICLLDGPYDGLIRLQAMIEGQGHDLHIVRNNLQLLGLTRAGDELLLLCDGLLPDGQICSELLEKGKNKAIATLPSDHPLVRDHPNDFERVDRECHWAGLALIDARQVQKLADLPHDADAISLLLRLALQTGDKRFDLDLSPEKALSWQLAVDQAEVAERETAFVKRAIALPPWTGPFERLSVVSVRSLSSTNLKNGPAIALGLSAFLGIGALLIASLGYTTLSLVVGAIGAFAAILGSNWLRVRGVIWSSSSDLRKAWLVDQTSSASAVILLALVLFVASGLTSALALPILAIGLSQLALREGALRWYAFWSDRTLSLVIFALASAFGFLSEALALFAIGALVVLLLRDPKA